MKGKKYLGGFEGYHCFDFSIEKYCGDCEEVQELSRWWEGFGRVRNLETDAEEIFLFYSSSRSKLQHYMFPSVSGFPNLEDYLLGVQELVWKKKLRRFDSKRIAANPKLVDMGLEVLSRKSNEVGRDSDVLIPKIHIPIESLSVEDLIKEGIL